MITLPQLVMILEHASAELPKAEHEILEKSCMLFEDSAKNAIGSYLFGWPPLGEAAVAKHGDTPLLDTGALRDSIEHNVAEHDAAVGTNVEYAKGVRDVANPGQALYGGRVGP
jgi:phage gpG-like protein